MALIGRIIVIFIAVVVASIACGIALSVALLWPGYGFGFTGDYVERSGFLVLVVFATSFTGAVMFLPLLIFVVVAESLRWRSLLLHLCAGAAMLVAGYFGSGFYNRYEESIDRPPPPIPHEVEIAAAGGAVFGLVYWLLAGRNAGRWRGR